MAACRVLLCEQAVFNMYHVGRLTAVTELSQNFVTFLFPAGSISGDIIDELMSSDVFPLLRLSPTPADDYNFNLDENEGVCDLFDVQILNY